MELKSQSDFCPVWLFEPRTSSLTVQRPNRSTTAQTRKPVFGIVWLYLSMRPLAMSLAIVLSFHSVTARSHVTPEATSTSAPDAAASLVVRLMILISHPPSTHISLFLAMLLMD